MLINHNNKKNNNHNAVGAEKSLKININFVNYICIYVYNRYNYI
jgi:hypothetical protein